MKEGVVAELNEDIYTLQISPNEAQFLKGTTLFLKKWRQQNNPKINDFLTYFEEQWLLKLPHWYEGAALGFPSTNNSLEATNSRIKQDHTLRKRLPVGQFLNNSAELLENWSRRREPSSMNCIEFAETPFIPLSKWTTAYQWS